MKIISVVDIGSFRVLCVVAAISNDGIKVLGTGTAMSLGMHKGQIVDKNALASAIVSAVYEAEKSSNTHIHNVYVCISDALLRSQIVKLKSKFNGKQITGKDLVAIKNKSRTFIDAKSSHILEEVVLEYDVDNQKHVKNPEHMYADTLSSYINYMVVPRKKVDLLNAIFNKIGIKAQKYYPSVYMSYLAACEKDVDVFVDIGAQLSSYIVLSPEGGTVDLGSIPLGGHTITKDICNYFHLEVPVAEKYKILHGGLHTSKHNYKARKLIPMGSHAIDNDELNEVITARFEEILSLLIQRVQNSGEPTIKRLVITGGASNMHGIEDFIMQKFNIDAYVLNSENLSDSVSNKDLSLTKEYAAVIGVLQSMLNAEDSSYGKSLINNMVYWLRENF